MFCPITQPLRFIRFWEEKVAGAIILTFFVGMSAYNWVEREWKTKTSSKQS